MYSRSSRVRVSSSSYRSFNNSNFEITKREVLMVIIIALILSAVAFGIGSHVSNLIMEENSYYHQAQKVLGDKDMLDYLLGSKAGHVLLVTPVKAYKSVTLPELKNQYSNVVKNTEKYTRHTRTTTDSDGKTRTEVYYSWDSYDTEKVNTSAYDFLGYSVATNLFDNEDLFVPLKVDDSTVKLVGNIKHLSGDYAYDDNNSFASVGDLRFSYDYVPAEFTSNFLINTSNGTIESPFDKQVHMLYDGVEERYAFLENRLKKVPVIASLITFGVVIALAYIIFRNDWHWLNKN